LGFEFIKDKHMNRYILAFAWKHPPDVSLADAEHEQVEKLIAEKKMEQMFLAENRSKGWLIMLAQSEKEALNAAATLPFYPVMHIDITPLVFQYP
jgi:muconolactone delta-isomerase